MHISFRPLREADLPLLHRWFRAPHADRWYGQGASDDEIDAEYLSNIRGISGIRSFVGAVDGRDVGLFDAVRLGDFPAVQASYGVEDPDTANVDVIVGEPDAAHRGLGPSMIRAHLEANVFSDPRTKSCVIDPEADNAIAIRAYEKAGFRFVRTADDGEGTHVYLLEKARGADVTAPDAPYLRPARAGELDVADALDDDACVLYASVGLSIDLDGTPTFFADERARWQRCLDEGRLLFACRPAGRPVGFAAYGEVDGRPYLHQISVERATMGAGVGRLLLDRVLHWSAGAGELWLTTYAGVPWNEGWYGRLGFRTVPELGHGPELRRTLEAERSALPAPERRIAMRHVHRAAGTHASFRARFGLPADEQSR